MLHVSARKRFGHPGCIFALWRERLDGYELRYPLRADQTDPLGGHVGNLASAHPMEMAEQALGEAVQACACQVARCAAEAAGPPLWEVCDPGCGGSLDDEQAA